MANPFQVDDVVDGFKKFCKVMSVNTSFSFYISAKGISAEEADAALRAMNEYNVATGGNRYTFRVQDPIPGTDVREVAARPWP